LWKSLEANKNTIWDEECKLKNFRNVEESQYNFFFVLNKFLNNKNNTTKLWQMKSTIINIKFFSIFRKLCILANECHLGLTFFVIFLFVYLVFNSYSYTVYDING